MRHFSNKAVSLAHACTGQDPADLAARFSCARGLEGQIEQAAAIACEAGVTNLAVWVDKYGTGDNNRSDDPEAVWEITKRLFQRLRA